MSQDTAAEMVEKIRAEAERLYNREQYTLPGNEPSVVLVASGDHEADRELITQLRLIYPRVTLVSQDKIEEFGLSDHVLDHEEINRMILQGRKTLYERDVGRGLVSPLFHWAPVKSFWVAPRAPNNQPYYRRFAQGRGKKPRY